MEQNNYMETLARAYNEKLHGILNPETTAAVAAMEEQLALLERLTPMRKRLLSYLRSLKQSIFTLLTSESGNNIIPSYRSVTPEGGLNRIIELELEIFISLDTLRTKTDNGEYLSFLDKVISEETRFSALLGNLK